MPGFLRRRITQLCLLTATLVIVAAAYDGLSAPAKPVGPEDSSCLTCHDGLDRTLAPTAHRLSSQLERPVVDVRCISCHPNPQAHLDDPSKETISNPSALVGKEVVQLCTQCHAGHVALDNHGYDAHSVQELSCSACHKVHGGDARLLRDDDAEFCLRCHGATRTQFGKASNHPVLQQNITCLDCHRFTSRQDHNLAYDVSSHCRDCHADQGGPFPFEHEANNAYSLEGSGCLACHDPHGSQSNSLLRQPGNRLCQQCHFPAGHMTAHGGIWASYACQVCHTDTHGSFVSNLYLDPNLPSKLSGSCYDIGCHALHKR